jgi:hypothetical protein
MNLYRDLLGWSAYCRERRDHQATSEAYDAALEQLRRALNELAGPCVLCEEMERERNNAILDLDTAKADLDDLHAALAWLERDFKVT